jgi:uncharacterized protein YkwD
MIPLSITERPPAAFSSRKSLRTHMREARCTAKKYLAAVFLAGAVLLPLASHAEEPQDQAPQASVGSQQIPINSGKAAEAVLSAVNAYRAENKIGELAWNNTLWQTAQHYAEFLAANKASGHGADGKIPQQRAEERGYPCPVAENAYSADPAETTDDEDTAALKAFDTWKNSPPDNDNLLSPIWTETGIGAAAWNHEGQTYYVFVQLFGHPCCGAKAEPSNLIEPAPAPLIQQPLVQTPGYVETPPVVVPVCPEWDPDCRGCPAGNPYCHRCPPWDPDCRRCPSWNPYCNKCPPWDPACRRCPPWNLHCHGCPPWNPNCRQCPPSNPNCGQHVCPNGGIWPRCNPIGHVCPNGGIWPRCNSIGHVCPNGGVWPRCNPIDHVCPNGGIWPRCNPIGHVCPNGGVWPECNKGGTHLCPNGGVWPRCNTVGHVCPNGGVWPNCNKGGSTHACPHGGVWPNCSRPVVVTKSKNLNVHQPPPKKFVVPPQKQIRQQQNFQKRLDTIRQNQRQNSNKPHHN